MKKFALLSVKALFFFSLFVVTYQMVNSSLDIYNNFAYDKAVLRLTPYGYIPLLHDPYDYRSADAQIKGGDFVYVEDWESADNGRVVFAKVRSKFSSGYINNRLLVEANINVMPIISVLLLGFMFIMMIRKIYFKLHKI